MPSDFFDDVKQKRQQLRAIFDALPVVTVHGVVDADGPGGTMLPPDVHWELRLDLMAWRIPGAPIRTAPLAVSKTVSEEELQTLKNALASESLVAFEGKMCENSPFGDARAQLLSVLAPPRDEALARVLSQYREPVEMDDPLVGKLVLNRSANQFEGKIVWLGRQIDLAVSLDEAGDPADALRTAEALLAAMEPWSGKVNGHAIGELLALKNDSWLEEDEDPVSEQAFLGRMQLNSITAYPDGAFTFWHDDGDLFWGHAIEVSGSLAEGITDAGIAG